MRPFWMLLGILKKTKKKEAKFGYLAFVQIWRKVQQKKLPGIAPKENMTIYEIVTAISICSHRNSEGTEKVRNLGTEEGEHYGVPKSIMKTKMLLLFIWEMSNYKDEL